MGREIRRVPLDFNWPIGEVWKGYLMPDSLHGEQCLLCDGSGWSPVARVLQDRWYGYIAFNPTETGSEPFTPEMPLVKEVIGAKVKRDLSGYYVNSTWNTLERAIQVESVRMCEHWNRAWSHHLAQEDVDALIEGSRLHDFTHTWSKANRWQPIEPAPVITAKQVNDWSIDGFGHDSVNKWVVVEAACARRDVSSTCSFCEGHGSVEKYWGQRAGADAWLREDPPTGEGWQLWETTTEGSPKSPVFATGDDLAVWMSQNPCGFAGHVFDLQVAMEFVHGDGWAPSMIGNDKGIMDGVTALVLLDRQKEQSA